MVPRDSDSQQMIPMIEKFVNQDIQGGESQYDSGAQLDDHEVHDNEDLQHAMHEEEEDDDHHPHEVQAV